jgi:hypothetical protein
LFHVLEQLIVGGLNRLFPKEIEADNDRSPTNLNKLVLKPELEFLKSLWGLGTEED